MKRYLPAAITGLIMCILGYLLAYQIYEGPDKPGKDESSLPRNYLVDTTALNALSYNELIDGIEKREKENITEYLEVNGVIETRKEGPVLKREAVNYLKGTLYNHAHVLSIKDISVKVEFYSQTGTMVHEESVVLFVQVMPLNITEFEAKINVPEEYNSIQIKIIDAKPAVMNLEVRN
jgi:hypothetical protein